MIFAMIIVALTAGISSTIPKPVDNTEQIIPDDNRESLIEKGYNPDDITIVIGEPQNET